MRILRATLFATLLISSLFTPSFASDTKRYQKQEAKRSKAIAALSPQAIADKATVHDDALEPFVQIDTESAFKWKGGFTDTVRADNFLRALVDRKTGEVSIQVYQTLSYMIDWRRFGHVNLMLPAGLKSMELTVIARDVSCQYGCVYTEVVGFNLTTDELDDVAHAYDQNPTATLKFRLKSPSGLDWDDDVPVVEVVGLQRAIAKWRSEAKLRSAGSNM